MVVVPVTLNADALGEEVEPRYLSAESASRVAAVFSAI